MANQALNIDQLSQSIADSVAAQLGIQSSSKLSDSLSSLIDIKKLLGKIIDPNKSVQADQKFPFIFSKTFDNVLKELKTDKKRESGTFFDALAKVPAKIEEKIANKAKDAALSLIPKSVKSKVLSFTGAEEPLKPKPVEPKPIKAAAEETKPVEPKPIESATEETNDPSYKNLPNIILKAFESFKPLNKPQPVTTELEKIDEPKPILFAGFTPDGLKSFNKEMPEIIKAGFKGVFAKTDTSKKTKDKESEFEFPGMSLVKGALSALAGVGGLLLVFDGIRTSEWYKGLEKILGKGLLNVSGFTKTIDKFIGKFVSQLIKIPARLIGNFSKSILGFFGKEAGAVALKTGLGASKSFIPKLLGNALKVIKKVPFVGSLISIGFAWDRFNKGDYLGGGLDVLSGIANAIPGLSPLSWAIDGLNAFLDYKAGGIGEGKKGKGAMIIDWTKQLGEWLGEKISNLPVVGPAIKAVQAVFDGNWPEALEQLENINPMVGLLKSFLSTDTGKSVASAAIDMSSKTANMFSGMKNNILSRVLDYIPETIWGYPLRAKVAELFGIGPKANVPETKPATNSSTEPASPKAEQVKDAQIDSKGGLVVSSPTEGSLFQLSKNDGIVAAPMSDKETATANNKPVSFDKAESILEKIANNTGTTNQNITNLITGFNNLAKALEKNLGEKMKIPTVINNVSGGQNQQSSRPSSSQYANLGNNDISNFRTTFVEGARLRPA